MDYYSILGVAKTASSEEIKTAYKKLAMTHHPDRGGDTNFFAQINEAYQVLKDPSKRAEYDQPQPKMQFNMNSNNFEDIFSTFFGQRTQQIRRNRDIKLQITLTLEEVALGKDFIAGYNLSNGQETTATIRIHPGVSNGEVIRYRGLGDNNITALPRGDLLIQVRVLNHDRFRRDGKHLHTNIDVSVFDLILGCSYVIDKLTTGPLRVNIPKGTNPGTILSIAGYGLPDTTGGTTGNMYITIKGTTPKIKDDKILERIKDLNDAINKST
jgi:DnaJ-class molecular chaperone